MSVFHALDENGFYNLRLVRQDGQLRVTYEGRRDKCSENLLSALEIEAEHMRYGFDPEGQITIHEDVLGPFTLYLKDTRLAVFSGERQLFDVVEGKGRKLSVFETRQMAREAELGVPYAVETNHIDTPITDLHTHISGAPSGEQIVKIGVELSKSKPIYYPVLMLDHYGIPYAAADIVENVPMLPFKELQTTDTRAVALHNLSDEAQHKLASFMNIPPDKRITFSEMEAIYDVRMPISKERDAFAPTLRALAEDYKKQGIQYVQLSSTAILRPDWLEIAHKVLPEIEKETGVKIRFLAALWRHASKGELQDSIAALQHVGQSPYIVGVDIVGHETNATPTEVIEPIMQWSKQHRPDFVHQVHAGENPHIIGNVLTALRVADKHGVHLQIGHGVFGVSDEGLRLQTSLSRRNLLMITMLPDSNLALNNIDDINQLPLKPFLHTTNLSVSSDGHGLYQTNARQSAMAAMFAGATAEDLRHIRQTEEKYIARQEVAFQKHMAAFPPDFFETLPPLERKYTTAQRDLDEKARDAHRQTVLQSMDAKGIETDHMRIAVATQGKTPLHVQGAARHSWGVITPENRKEIAIAFTMLVQALDPEKVYLLTGGVKQGVEAELFKAVYDRDHHRGHGAFTVLGRVPPEVRIDELSAHTLTHGQIIGQKWSDLAAANVRTTHDGCGLGLYVGGGIYVKDAILQAGNKGLNFGLMSGPEGASTTMVKDYPESAFTGAAGMIKWLHSQRPDLFAPHFDISKIDDLYFAAAQKVSSREQVLERQFTLATSVVMVTHDNEAVYPVSDNRVALVLDRRKERDCDSGLISAGGMVTSEGRIQPEQAARNKTQQELDSIIDVSTNPMRPLPPYIDYDTDPSKAIMVQPFIMELMPDQLKAVKAHIERMETDANYAQAFAIKTDNESDRWRLMPLYELAASNEFLFTHEQQNYAAAVQEKGNLRGLHQNLTGFKR